MKKRNQGDSIFYFTAIMRKFELVAVAILAVLLFSCSSTQVGLTENWIDERDVIALKGASVSKWMETAGRPTLVEINGDTSIYYYNYKPTLYAAVIYDSTTFFASWGTVKEAKPALANATEVWGSRKNVMQIKVVNDSVITAMVSEGPDRKVFVRDLHGNIVLDQNSGYIPNISGEQKIDRKSEEYSNAINSIGSEYTWTSADKKHSVPSTRSPWEDYRYKQQKINQKAGEHTEPQPEPAAKPVAESAATEPQPEPAAEPQPE